MRVVLFSLLLVAGAQASFLADLGDAFKNTFKSLVDSSKEVGQSLLEELKVTAGQLTSQDLQSEGKGVAR